MIPNWFTHCPAALGVQTKPQLMLAVEILIDLGTCFCVDMDTHTVHTTERGAVALVERYDEIEALA